MHMFIKFFKTEALITASMFRYWLMVLCSFVFAFALFVLNAAAHANYSAYSSSINLVAPSDGIAVFSEICLTIFLVLMVLLCVDIRARDARSQMVEVLDSRPYTNAALVFGRLFGVFAMVWLSLVAMLLLLNVLGWLLPLTGAAFGGTMDPWSIYAFAVYMAMPALIFCGGFSVLMALLLRNRFLALAATLALVFVGFSLAEGKPYAAALAVDMAGGLQLAQSSEWGASFASEHWWMQRMGIVFIGLGFILFGVLIHPRLDSGLRLRQATFATLAVSAGVALVFGAYHWQVEKFKQVETWREMHASRQFQPVDLLSIEASVKAQPGDLLSVDAKLEIRNRGEKALSTLLFTLNPGVEVAAIKDQRGQNLPFVHKRGLLDITFTETLPPAGTVLLAVTYHGIPDTKFAYLDSDVCLCDRSIHNGLEALRELGTDAGIFSDRYLALMPGLHWLPTPGTAIASAGERDFFELNLQVALPAGWTAVGPGKITQTRANPLSSNLLWRLPKWH